MGTRSFVAAIVLLSAGVASADPKGEIKTKAKEAMESYDLMDYDAAKKLLDQALAVAKKAKLEKDPVTAKVYLDIGIAAFAASDQAGCKTAFLSAAQIDPKINIEPAYKSPELVKLLDEAKAEALGGPSTPLPGGPDPIADSGADCKAVKGLQHTIIDTAKSNTPQPIEAMVGSDIKPVKVSLMFRPEKATDFTEVKLSGAGCKYTGAIPAAAMHGSVIHYYVAAFDANNKVISGKGSAGAPNIVELTAGPALGAAPKDDEDPINGKKPSGGSSPAPSGDISTTIPAGPSKPPRVMLAVAGGTGFGYAGVNGKTEGENMVRTGGFANSFVVITPELGYYASPQLSVGIAARLGLPLGASTPDHATLAPAALLRVRYAFSPSGEGVRLLVQGGVGILRNTIKLDGPMGQTDIVAQGPLLVGAGIGYTKRVSGNIAFLADFAGIAGIAVVDHLGSAPHLNTGISADLNLGLALGF